MQRKHAVLKIIAFILVHSFLLFDASRADGLQSFSAASATCLNAPLQISEKALTEPFARMIQDAKKVVSIHREISSPKTYSVQTAIRRIWQRVIKIASETVGIHTLLLVSRASPNSGGIVPSFPKEYLDHIVEYGWEYALLAAVIIGVALFYIIEKIVEDNQEKGKNRKQQAEQTRKNVAETGGSEKKNLELSRGDKYRVINSAFLRELEERLDERGYKEKIELFRDNLPLLNEWASRIESVTVDPKEILLIGAGLIIAQGNSSERLEEVLKIIEALPEWYVRVWGKGYERTLLEDFLRDLEEDINLKPIPKTEEPEDKK